MLSLGTSRLSIYLNDHLAGATVGVELARRTAASNRSTDYGRALTELAAEIERDRETLVEIMKRLSLGRDRVKLLVSWGAEKAGRLKLNGQLRGYSPLSRLEELEALSLGVEGKMALWQALRRTHGADPRLGGIDFEELIERARSQRRRFERQRRRAAEEALT
ncbi:MAG: hypothetical protein ACR2IN_08290 [Thermoleophilaceae bacterium]